MFFLKYNGKLLFHSEICDFHSLVSDKELDIKEDKSLVRRLFGRLQSSTMGDKAFFSFENVLYCIVISRCWIARRLKRMI